ncbi:hypothetical protein C5022_000015 [Pseudomonas phage vB_PaeP_130_113]|uniref:Uncharacterized protein n=1 Tax=Pseudomonas phage vB_PaeP_130_113 TaxID=2161784 RepID=A0A2R4P988_9CAUD|nr:hypothetical protein HOT07_gp15 [Pseudomonas phage vB_PaeP_130_113]AVX47618.1 hypothetical protein C5022_000015 [Pseudomonas phage vB_PaeP_130_113]
MIRTHTHKSHREQGRLYDLTDLHSGEMYQVVQPESKRGTLVVGVAAWNSQGRPVVLPVVIHDSGDAKVTGPRPTVLRNDGWRMVLADKGTQVTLTAE